MNRNEILIKARQEGKAGTDDGTKYMLSCGRRMGYLLSTCVFLIIAVFSSFTGKELNPGVLAMFFAFPAGESFSQWWFTKSRFSLFAFLVAAAAILFQLYRYVGAIL